MAIIDLIQNECMLAIPVSMDVPVVGFWLTLPIGKNDDLYDDVIIIFVILPIIS